MSACTLMAESRSRSMNINVSTFDEVKGQWFVVLTPQSLAQDVMAIHQGQTYAIIDGTK